jgi:L-asparaginase / beta-aspartyl-peptidase
MEIAMKKTLPILRLAFCVVLVSLMALPAQKEAATAAQAERQTFVLIAHGGAGDYSKVSPEQLAAKTAAMTQAVQAGYAVLAGGGTSLDAVETTIRLLENSGEFDAGRGAYYTRDGVPELDAAIMDGKTLNAGAVAAVKRIANPISLARLVMQKTPHVLLVGDGAEQFAASQGVSLVSPFYFYNEREWKRYQDMKADAEKNKSTRAAESAIHGTVGVVALDQAGNLAAGTSTGGTTFKMPGRVGDSPLIGAGTYANNDSCGISGTGVGEYFIRNVVAADICARVRYLHVPLQQAANDVVMQELVAQHGEGGIIGIDRNGEVADAFNSNGMMRAVVHADGKIAIKVRKE